MSSLAVTYFKPYQPGIERTVSGFRFALVNKKNGCESGILLYDDKKQEQRIPLSEKGRKGELFGVEIRGEDLNQLTYNFYDGDEIYTDPYVQGVAGLEQFGKKARGFVTEEALLLGVESRTSSPLRIPRETEKMVHPEIVGLYPCGEGAGYAGGIVSAAMDGEGCAEAIG